MEQFLDDSGKLVLKTRKTFLLPIAKIIGLQIIFVAVYVLLLWQLNESTSAPLKSGGIIAFLILQSVQSFWALYIIIRWFFQYYEVTTKELRVQSGWVSQKGKVYSLDKAESASIHQGLLGQMFNFGTVEVEFFMSNNQTNRVQLKQIPSPEVAMRIIQKSLQEFGSNQQSQ